MKLTRSLLLAILMVSAISYAQAQEDPPHGIQERTLDVDGLTRHFLLYLPDGYDGESRFPVVFMLHGGGGTGKAALEETGWTRKADEAGFLVVAPDATRPDPDRPAKFSGNSPIWNDGSGRFHAGAEDVPDVAFLNALLDNLIQSLAVDERRIYVTGFSNGASMTFRTAAELSERIAAAAPVAGALWLSEFELARPVPLLYMTGTKDTLNPLDGGMPTLARGKRSLGGKEKPPVIDSVLAWARAIHCPEEPKETREENGVKTIVYGPGDEEAEVVFITIEGAGHTWSGGESKLPAWMVGEVSDKLDATDRIWAFFEEHPREEGD